MDMRVKPPVARKDANDFARQVARLAAQLDREPAAKRCSVAEIAGDAFVIVMNARSVRARLEAGKPAASFLPEIRRTLLKYNAELVEQNDLAGMVLGVRFQSGTYRNGFSDVFHIV